MKMKTTNESNRIFWGGGVTLFLALLLFCSTARAQCPGVDEIDPISSHPRYTPWIGSTTVNSTDYNIGTCSLRVYFCFRFITSYPVAGQNTYQTYIYKIEQLGGDCSNIDLLTWVNAADEAVSQTAQGNPDCDSYPLPQMTQVRPACWKNHGGGVYTACGSGKCLKTFGYCYENGRYEPKGTVTYQSVGTPTCVEFVNGIPEDECGLLPCGSNP